MSLLSYFLIKMIMKLWYFFYHDTIFSFYEWICWIDKNILDMEQEQTFILKDCKRTFYKLDKDGKPFCRVGMYIYLEGLTLWRYDFQSWDYNEKNGIVRMNYSVSLVGVRQMCRLLGVYDSLTLIKRLKKECGFRVGYQKFIENFMAFCDKNSIQYNFNVWYWE